MVKITDGNGKFLKIVTAIRRQQQEILCFPHKGAKIHGHEGRRVLMPPNQYFQRLVGKNVEASIIFS